MSRISIKSQRKELFLEGLSDLNLNDPQPDAKVVENFFLNRLIPYKWS